MNDPRTQIIMTSFENKLPIEHWQQVLRNVSHGDLCNVMLASRHMNTVASWPELWAGMRINMGKMRENGLAQLYSIKRFRRIKEIDFGGMNFTSTELEGLFIDIHGSPLESVNFAGIDLRGVRPELLSIAAGRLKTMTLWNTHLTTEQCVKVLKASISTATLISINFSRNNLSGVPAILLANAVRRLKTVNLDHSRLTTDQCIKVLAASISSTTLVSIDLLGSDLSGVPANLLASAVSRLKTVKLYNLGLTTDQCIKILEASISSTTLVSIDLAATDLSEVPPNLLASAVSRLKTVKLCNLGLTTDQCIKILEASISSTTLVSIDLVRTDLSGVPPNLLASAVRRLKTVNLDHSRLTTDQCIKVLAASISSTTLDSIDLVGTDLSGVPPNLLASAVSRLKTVKLCNLGLTTDQCIKILEASISSTTLVSIDLSGTDLRRVPPNLLASAVSRLKTVRLVCSRLTPEQCVAVLRSISSSTTLRHVDLTRNHIETKIPTELQYLITSLPSHVTLKM